MNPTLVLKKLVQSFSGRPASTWKFSDLADSYKKRLAATKAPRARPGGTKVGVVITPWLFTAVPFFSMECGLMLANAGCEVTFIWDASNVFFNVGKQSEADRIAEVLALTPKSIAVLDVSKMASEPIADPGFIESLLYENAVRQVGGEADVAGFRERAASCDDPMHTHAGRISALLREQAFDWLFVPGGVWAVSGVYLHLANKFGVSFTTFDSGLGALFLTQNGAAAHFSDIPKALAELKRRFAIDPDEKQRVMDEAHAELHRRMEGNDEFKLQLKPASAYENYKCDILVPLNLRGDTAALLRQRLFSSVTEWLTALLRWLETQPGVTMFIRQHPCERIEEYRGSDRWEDLLAQTPSLARRVRLIKATDTVNTYDLIRNAAVVLPFTSRVGIEAAILGKPVILSAECFYQDCGFAWKAESVEQYFSLIGEAIKGRLTVGEPAREDATTAYYLVEKCLALPTNFTPHPDDFREWVKLPPDELWAQPANADARAVLLGRRPLPVVRHERAVNTIVSDRS